MSKLNFVRRCHECGVPLQCDDESMPGFVEARFLENTEHAALFCRDCFQKQHFNFAPQDPVVSPGFLEMLRDAQASDALIVYVVDLFSFESSFSQEVNSIIEGLPMVVIANKRDLLPKSYSDAKLREYVAHRFRCARLSVKADDVHLVSLTSSIDVSAIARACDEKRAGHDVYVVGGVGAGKSQLISAFLREYTNPSFNSAIQTANYGSTDIRVLQIPLPGSSFAYETPGIPLSNSISAVLSAEQARGLVPQEAVKAVAGSLSQGEALYISGLAKIELLKGVKTPVSSYFPRGIKVKKGKQMGKKDPFFEIIRRDGFAYISEKATQIGDFDVYDVEVSESDAYRDIGVEGLGWICFYAQQQVFRVYVPHNVAIYTTRAKITPKEKKQ